MTMAGVLFFSAWFRSRLGLLGAIGKTSGPDVIMHFTGARTQRTLGPTSNPALARGLKYEPSRNPAESQAGPGTAYGKARYPVTICDPRNTPRIAALGGTTSSALCFGDFGDIQRGYKRALEETRLTPDSLPIYLRRTFVSPNPNNQYAPSFRLQRDCFKL